MLASLGKKIRSSRIIDDRTGRGFCVAFDHAVQLGGLPGLNQPEKTLDLMTEAGVDAVILPLGSALRYGHKLARRGAPALILRVDQTTMWREGTPLDYADGHTRLTASVEQAVELGADAVITYLFFAHNDPSLETKAFEDVSRINAAAHRLGVPHIIETMGARHAKAADVFDPKFVAFHARVGMELGADIIKTDWPGSASALRDIANELPIPVMLAGGPSKGSDRGTLELVHDVVTSGAAGILFGRALFQAKNPLGVMKACRAIIHDGASLEAAAAIAGL